MDEADFLVVAMIQVHLESAVAGRVIGLARRRKVDTAL
jgi:hypothetical protein